MAMNKDTLGALITAKVDALPPTDQKVSVKVWTAVADAIIEHIKSNAEIGSLPIETGTIMGTDSLLVPLTFSAYGNTESGQTKIT
jgi:hypothetical protein